MISAVTKILTVVAGDIDDAREPDLLAAYRAVTSEALPDGLEESSLLRGPEGRWQIATLWRDRAALAAMRDSGEAPAAFRVFAAAGSEAVLTVFEVAETLRVSAD